MSRYFAGKVVPIITTFISGQRKIQENNFSEVFNIGFLLICGLGYWAIVWQVELVRYLLTRELKLRRRPNSDD
jgi:hypothetical protein